MSYILFFITCKPLYLNFLSPLFTWISPFKRSSKLTTIFIVFYIDVYKRQNISSIVRMGRTAGLALDDYIKQRKAGIDTPVFNRSVLNHTFGIVWWGEGQTTDSSVPATPVEDTIEK